jgi:hypothetical protein
VDAHEFSHALGEVLHMDFHIGEDHERLLGPSFFAQDHADFHTHFDAVHAGFHGGEHELLHAISDMVHSHFHEDFDPNDSFDVLDHNELHSTLDQAHAKLHDLGLHGAIHFFLDDAHAQWHADHDVANDHNVAKEHADWHQTADILHDQLHIIYGIPK